MESAFKIKLGRKFEARLVVCGKFDGHQPAVACASGTCGQVLLYYPHEQGATSSGRPELRTLTFNKTLTALGCGALNASLTEAEDARLMADMPLMKRHYADLFTLNNELIAEYNKRANNHEALLAALKEVNQIIQKAANLRVGAPKARVIAESRAAIKSNNIDSLYHIICDGKSNVSLAQ